MCGPASSTAFRRLASRPGTSLARGNQSIIRVVVVSDTHVPRFARRFEKALALVRAEAPDLILHCGDFTEPEAIGPLEAIAPFDGVAGNNDGAELVRRFGLTKILELGKSCVGLVHGHGGERGSTEQRARAAFANRPLAAILFGHSHVPLCERRDGTWLINPGSPTDKRRQPRYSYAVIDAGAACFEPRLVFFD